MGTSRKQTFLKMVDVSDEAITEAYHSVRDDNTAVDWFLAGYSDDARRCAWWARERAAWTRWAATLRTTSPCTATSASPSEMRRASAKSLFSSRGAARPSRRSRRPR